MIYDRIIIDVFSIEFANIGLLPELPRAAFKNIPESFFRTGRREARGETFEFFFNLEGLFLEPRAKNQEARNEKEESKLVPKNFRETGIRRKKQGKERWVGYVQQYGGFFKVFF